MKKNLIATGILILLTTVVCIDRLASPASRLRRILPTPVDTEWTVPARGIEQANAPGGKDQERIATPSIKVSFSPDHPPAGTHPQPSADTPVEPAAADPQSSATVNPRPPSGAVLPMELLIETIDNGPDLETTFSNKSPLLVAIRFDGDLFKLERWMSKTVGITRGPTMLEVFVWARVNGKAEWQAVYSSPIDPRPGALRLPLESNHDTPIKPAGPPPPDEEP